MALFDMLKSAAETLRKTDKIEEYKQILDVQEKLLEMQNRINSLEKENIELKEKLKIKESLIYENHAYWINLDNKKDGPFCSRCWDAENKIIRLHPCINPAYYECPNCDAKPVRAKPGLDSWPKQSQPHRDNFTFY